MSVLTSEGSLDTSSIRSADVFPIGVSDGDIDVFLLGAAGTPLDDQVFWFAGREIERFPTFEAFFTAMTQLIEEETRRLSVG